MHDDTMTAFVPTESTEPNASTRLPVVSGRSKAPEPERRVKPPVDPNTMAHRDLLGGEFWRRVPAYADVDESTFLDYRWQMKHSVTKVTQLDQAIQVLASGAPSAAGGRLDFLADVH